MVASAAVHILFCISTYVFSISDLLRRILKDQWGTLLLTLNFYSHIIIFISLCSTRLFLLLELIFIVIILVIVCRASKCAFWRHIIHSLLPLLQSQFMLRVNCFFTFFCIFLLQTTPEFTSSKPIISEQTICPRIKSIV